MNGSSERKTAPSHVRTRTAGPLIGISPAKMKRKANDGWSETGDYESAPKSDWGATLIVIILVVMAFAIVTALTDEPEQAAIGLMGEIAYQLKS